MNASDTERFWSKVSMPSTEDCWDWQGSITRSPRGDYGVFWIGGRGRQGTNRPAHAVAYELVIGPIPSGMVLDHKSTCFKTCVNPHHLRPVTRKQNAETRRTNSSTASGFRGVHKTTDGKWSVEVGHNRERHYGGRFSSPDEANKAAIELRRKLYGDNYDW